MSWIGWWRTHPGGLRLATLLALLLLSTCCRSHAETLSLRQLVHTRWTTRDGAPPSILALAQTPDGVLWIGTPAGLYTFNGYEFRPFHSTDGRKLPSLVVAALAEDGQGGLWVGLRYGGIAHISSQRLLVTYGAQEGVHPGNVQQVAASSEGRAWAVAGNELIRFNGWRWESVGPTEGDSTNDEHGVDAIYPERDGTLWVMFASRLYRVRPGSTSFEPTREHSNLVNTLRRSPDGQLWLADQLAGIRRACPDGCRRETGLNAHGVTDMTFDAAGNLWASSVQGVLRVQPARLRVKPTEDQPAEPAVERITEAQGLTSDHATCVLRDREGNIWVGTLHGLDRFQRSAFAAFPAASLMEPTSIVADARGVVWFGTSSSGLQSVRSLSHSSPLIGGSAPRGAPNGHTNLMLAPGVDDTLLISRNSALMRLELNGRLRRLPTPPLLRNFPIFAMAEDASSGLFVTLARNGVWRHWNGRWSPVGPSIRSSANTPMALCFDQRHRLWMGFPDGRVEIMDTANGRIDRVTGAESLGSVLVIALIEEKMWMGGASGVAWSDGVAIHPLKTTAALDSLRGVSGIVESAEGSYWFNGAAGIVRVSADEIRRALADPHQVVVPRLFDGNDGLDGVAMQVGGRPTAVRDAAGRLWFSTTSGLFFIDPLHISVNPVPPSVRVTSLQMDDARLEAGTSLTVPPGIHTLRIGYEGVSLTSPERVIYRYKLDGEDKEWQNADTLREAVYTGLHPGRYVFHVMAANASGVWSGPEPLLSVRVRPSFYQTMWFALACVGVGCFMMWLAFQWRVRFVIARVEEKLNERARERVRIARDLHDTLLQGIQGLVLRFHFAAEQVPIEQPAHALLSQALSRADQVISEGRERVKQLRGQPSSTDVLLKGLLETAENERWDRPVEVRTLAEGETRPLRALVYDELYAIGREAIVNALRHAAPTCIEIELISQANELRLRCRDNGIGMPAHGARLSGEHWGILGMEERAARLGARFDLWSAPGAGTEIEVRVRAVAAYAATVHDPTRFSLAHLFVHSDE